MPFAPWTQLEKTLNVAIMAVQDCCSGCVKADIPIHLCAAFGEVRNASAGKPVFASNELQQPALVGYKWAFDVERCSFLTYCVALSCVAYYSCPICLLVMVFLMLKEVSSCCLLSRDRSSKWYRVIPNLMWAGISSNTLLLSDR